MIGFIAENWIPVYIVAAALFYIELEIHFGRDTGEAEDAVINIANMAASAIWPITACVMIAGRAYMWMTSHER